MTYELNIIKLLINKDLYIKYRSFIDYNYYKDNYKELSYILKVLDDLHAATTADFSVDDLETYFSSVYPDASKDIYPDLFKDLRSVQMSEEVGRATLTQIKRRKALLSLSEAAYGESSGHGKPGMLEKALLEYSDLTAEAPLSNEEDSFVTTDLEEILSNVTDTPGIRWPLDCLNKSLGSLRRGDFGFVFARPETGKTTFMAHVAAAALRQIREDVLWFNNEEEGEKVVLRVMQAYFGATLDQIKSNRQHYNRVFNAETAGAFKLIDDASLHKDRVDRILSKTAPGLIIYDQLDKVQGFKADRDDLIYGQKYQWARENAKRYAPSIGVCQAGGNGEGVKWLTMDHVVNAKTSKQAEADFIIGLGKTYDEATKTIRYINISKNKLMGDTDTLPDLRHGHFDVLIKPEIAQYKDIIEYA